MIKTLAPYICAVVLFAAWFALVILNKAPAADFVTALTGALSGLGVHAVHLTAAKVQSNA